ncbi:MAG: CPBP family intramembrane metalloprotease [Clostridiales bacterium]|jgi:membrane protease YdiL (CAAX protease family)|nr:CPBP family intramembrane metalloprotease [Clostridiales bacterium]
MKTLNPALGNTFMFLTVLFSVFAAFFIETPFLIMGMDPADIDDTLINGLFPLIGLFLPFLAFMAMTKRPLKEVAPIKPISFANVALILGMALFLQPAALFVSELSSVFFGNDVSETISGFVVKQPFHIVVITSCLFPAVFEELLTRGAVLSCYRNVGVKKAAVINGLFFGILHMNPEQFFYAFMYGVAFTYFVYYTRSIVASFLAHFSINFSQVALVSYSYKLLPQEDIDSYINPTTPGEGLSLLFPSFVIAVFSMLAFSVLFYIFANYNKRKNAEDDITGDFAPIDRSPQRTFTWSFFALVAVFIIFTLFNLFS